MSSSSSTLGPPVDLGNTFGALFIGVVLTAVLFGLSNVQAFIYFQTHGDTGTTFYKLVVVLLWILDALHLAFIVHCLYYCLVTNYANAGAEVVWSFKLQSIITARPPSDPEAILPVMVWELYQCRVSTEDIEYEWALYMALASSTAIDILIASSLCYLLATSRTGFSSTDSFINKLMGYVINTGCSTSMCSLATIITCAAMPRNFIYLAVDFLLPTLYTNSYMALLNARYYLQPDVGVVDSPSPRLRYNVHNPQLLIRASQDDTPEISRKNLFEREVV
ncbi:hypothetical protein M405DRAFT_938065 [Rhizopogon salebrosus TDB-379]|nr:hypothetical protein M405DRAFT_938065 [Rhizopogon salebrosus TDB-379]